MNNTIIKVGCTWEYFEDPDRIEFEHFTKSEEFDDKVRVPISLFLGIKSMVCLHSE